MMGDFVLGGVLVIEMTFGVCAGWSVSGLIVAFSLVVGLRYVVLFWRFPLCK